LGLKKVTKQSAALVLKHSGELETLAFLELQKKYIVILERGAGPFFVSGRWRDTKIKQ